MGQQNKPATNKLFVYLRICFVCAALLAVVIWVCRQQRYVILAQSFAKMGAAFFVGILGAFIISQIILAMRWWLLLRTQEVRISVWAAVRLHFLGLFYNNCIPGSVGGDLVRAWYVTKHTHRRFEAALSVFVDRFIAFLSSMAMAGFCWFVLLRDVELPKPGRGFALVVMWAGIIVAAIIGITALLPQGRKLLARGYQAFLEAARKFSAAVVLYGRNPLTIAAVFVLTLLLQGMVIAGFWLIGRQIGMNVSVKYYFVFFPMTWAFGAIPVSIGGAGVIEFGLAGLFTLVGAGAEQALALALLQRAVWIIAALPGAWIHWKGRHLPSQAPMKEVAVDCG